MAHASTDFIQRGRTGLRAQFDSLRAAYERHARTRTAYRKMVDELHAYSDRDLAELGYHRSEIGRIAREASRNA
ncbi:protein of unknown function [Palleronia salina]|uniref:DUF1127 domain-containing protein n=1 Tax=Palleronia salina TaxID=313368 RepID=A0A1M6IXN4_9RHOB|nr:DUF1127 domain-containing protein [Palleronia salina]SHJ39177.1 protein of unknown function [Palleronia salina]